MILDAAETVLGYFGFDRNIYGDKKNIGVRKWKWLEDLKREREQDRDDGKTMTRTEKISVSLKV